MKKEEIPLTNLQEIMYLTKEAEAKFKAVIDEYLQEVVTKYSFQTYMTALEGALNLAVRGFCRNNLFTGTDKGETYERVINYLTVAQAYDKTEHKSQEGE